MNDKKYKNIIRSGLILSVITLSVLFLSKQEACITQQKQIIIVILIFSAALAILYLIFNFIASVNKKLLIWSSALNTALIIYYGILIFSLAWYKELISEILEFDVSMGAFGIAIIAFGWSFVNQRRQEQITREDYQNLESNVIKLSKKLSTINRKIDNFKK